MRKINNYYKKSLIIFVLFSISLLLVTSAGAQEKNQSNSQNTNGLNVFSENTKTIDLENFEGENIVSDIINFVISKDSVIKAQKEVIKVAQEIDLEKSEETNNQEKLPKYIQSNLQQKKMESASKKQQVQEKYANLKRNLVEQLLTKISEIFSYKNQIINQKELHTLLLEREGSIKRQVEAGIMEPKALQNLSERINQVQTSIANAKLNMKMLKMEIAFNYGGGEWGKLLELIDKLETSLYQ